MARKNNLRLSACLQISISAVLVVLSTVVTGLSNLAFVPRHSMNALKNISKSHLSKFCRNRTNSKSRVVRMASSSSMIVAPVARRDEDCVVWAGKVNDVGGKKIRQFEGSGNALLDPPRAVSDPYGWLRDESRTSEEVLKHLQQENEYTQQMTSHQKEFQETLYQELVSYLQETDHSVLVADRGYYYYTRTIKGFSYRLHCRAPIASTSDGTHAHNWDGSVDAPIVEGEEVYLNENELAKDQSYCSVSSVRASPSSNLFSYAIDVTGDEVYSLVIQNFASGEIIDTLNIEDDKAYDSSIVWGADDDTYFYLMQDEAHRPYQVYKRTISKQTSELIFEDLNDLNFVDIYKSSDDEYLFIDSSSPDTSEIHFVKLTSSGEATTNVQIVAKREEKNLYEVDHWNGHWIISTNDHGTLPNMKLCISPAIPNSASQWKDLTLMNDGATVLFDGSRETSVNQVQSFQKYIAVSGRQEGIPRIWILSLEENTEDVKVNKKTLLTFPEEAYDVAMSINRNFNSQDVLLYYSSLITPPQWIQVPMKDHDMSERIVLKQKHIPGYNKDDYGCERFTVLSRDGQTHIPVSMLYRKDVMEDNTGKVKYIHQYGYGSYGASCEADFSANRLPLLKKGIIYVCAHVRGGGEMGRYWYDDPKNGGKYLCKQNTFHDFVDVSRFLKQKFDGCQLSIEGRSAGGLLIGASINQAPDLYNVAILGVPFVDVVCTMIDSTIPLTCTEWEEWGNPNEESYFDYMMSYSPINNVQTNATYPSCLLTGGLYDPRVQYWEPTKFAAELRHQHNKENSGPICLKIDMTAGHFSASDRYKYLKELAFDYSFLLDQLNLVTS